MFKNFFIFIIGLALFTQSALYLYEHQNNAAILANGKTEFKTLKLSDIRKNAASSSPESIKAVAVAIKNCSFETDGAPTHFPAVFSEIAWMGSVTDANDEWFKIKKVTSDAIVDISLWQIISQNDRLRATIPKQTALTDYRPSFELHRGRDYSGALKNNNEGLRLFDTKCNLIDEVFASPQWPAGDNSSKETMKRAPDLQWHTIIPTSVITPTTSQKPSVISQSDQLSVIVSNPNPKPAAIPDPNLQTSNVPDPNSQKTVIPEPNQQPPVIPDPDPTTAVIPDSDPESIKIIAIQAGTDQSASDEFIKLFNPGNDSVNLTGWTLKKKTASGTEYSLVSKSKFIGIISAQNEFIVAHPDYSGAANLYYSASSNSLAYENNNVLLYNKDGVLVHDIKYSKINKNEIFNP